MPMLRKLRIDKGITLLEVLVAITITAVISVVLVRVTIDSSKALQNRVDSLVATQSAILFANAIRYDVAGSYDVFAYDSTAPADTTTLCSSWTSTATASQWLTTPTTSTFIRGLITIKEKEVSYDRTSAANPSYQTATVVWIGYELRRAAYTTNQKPAKYTLWRVTCADNNGRPSTTISTAKQMVDLGTAIDSNASGKSSLTCNPTACGTAGVSAGSGSTAGGTTYYSFALPYAVSGSTAGASKHLGLKSLSNDSLNSTANELLQRMFRRINT